MTHPISVAAMLADYQRVLVAPCRCIRASAVAYAPNLDPDLHQDLPTEDAAWHRMWWTGDIDQAYQIALAKQNGWTIRLRKTVDLAAMRFATCPQGHSAEIEEQM